jgi:peptide deformylase
MKELRILTIANPQDVAFLQSKSEPVENVFKGDIQDFIDDMVYTMFLNRGCGISAPQVGRALRIIVVNAEGTVVPMVMINPNIVERSFLTRPSNEGCLSAPGEVRQKSRAFWVEVHYLNRDGLLRTLRCVGTFSCIVQHEIDHLDGRLIV